MQRANAEVEYANALAQEQKSNLAGYGEAYLALGIMPSAEMHKQRDTKQLKKTCSTMDAVEHVFRYNA